MANSFEQEQERPELETLATLAENLVYRLPGCTDVMIRKTIQEVFRDFCRRSLCLRTERHFILEPDKGLYPIGSILDGVIDSVAEVRLNGRTLRSPFDYSVMGVGNVIVALDPFLTLPSDYSGDDVHLDCSVIEIPKIGSEKAPIGFIQKYGEYICSGVLAKLMMMTGKAWSDSTQASTEMVRYENGVAEARFGYYQGSNSGSGNIGFGFDNSDLI